MKGNYSSRTPPGAEISMTVFYKCDHFDIEELVDRKTFERWGQQAWMFFRPEALISLDKIRVYFQKSVIVNDWAFGGRFQNRGLRPPHSITGGDYSQHRFGNGFDLDVKGVTAEEVRKEILAHKDDPHFEKITCLETDITWVHFDCRNIAERIRLVKP